MKATKTSYHDEAVALGDPWQSGTNLPDVLGRIEGLRPAPGVGEFAFSLEGVKRREIDWQLVRKGLLFEGDRIVGHEVQYGFVCNELALWQQIATAEHRPALVAWGLEAEGRLPKVWSARVPLDELVRDAAASLTDGASA